eukprot:Nk52_evm6s2241 gene=Nk52_evmTU6s2241
MLASWGHISKVCVFASLLLLWIATANTHGGSTVMGRRANMTHFPLQHGLVTYTSGKSGIRMSYDFPVSLYSPAVVTVSFWVFVGEDPCTMGMCGVLYRISTDFETPAMMINNEGQLFFQNRVHSGAGREVQGALSTVRLERNTWSWVAIAIGQHFSVATIMPHSSGTLQGAGEISSKMTYTKFLKSILWPNSATWYLGGCMYYHSFKGALFDVRVYMSSSISHIPWYNYYTEAFRKALSWGIFEILPYRGDSHVQALSEIAKERPVRWLAEGVLSDKREIYNNSVEELKKSGFDEERILSVERVLHSMNLDEPHYPSLTMSALLKLTGVWRGSTDEVDSQKEYQKLIFSSLNEDKLAMFAVGYKMMYNENGAKSCCECGFRYMHHLASSLTGVEKASENQILSPFTRLLKENLEMRRNEATDIVDFTRAQANHGDPGAIYNMGVYNYAGHHGLERNLPEAARLFREAAGQGQTEAIFNLGVMHLNGEGVEKDEEKAIELMEKAANDGHPQAMCAMGTHYIQKGEIEKAMEWIIKAKNKGSDIAYLQLGKFYRSGVITEKDIGKAYEHFKFAYLLGNEEAAVELSELIVSKQVPNSSCENALKLLTPIAARIDTISSLLDAAFNLYLDGAMESAMVLYLVLAEAGVEVAQYNSALLFNELHTHSNETFATQGSVNFFNKSAMHGFAESLVRMGDFHYHGNSFISRNLSRSTELYNLAANQGYQEAIYNLGFMRERSIGPFQNESREENINRALDHYRECCEFSLLFKDESFAILPGERGFSLLKGNLSLEDFFELTCLPCSMQYFYLKSWLTFEELLERVHSFYFWPQNGLMSLIDFAPLFSSFDRYDALTIFLLALVAIKVYVIRR